MKMLVFMGDVHFMPGMQQMNVHGMLPTIKLVVSEKRKRVVPGLRYSFFLFFLCGCR